MRLRKDRARGGAPDAGQGEERVEIGGKRAAVSLHAQFRGGVQVAGAGVVAKPRPQRHHLVVRGGGE